MLIVHLMFSLYSCKMLCTTVLISVILGVGTLKAWKFFFNNLDEGKNLCDALFWFVHVGIHWN